MKIAIIQSLKRDYGIISDTVELLPISNAGDNVLFQYGPKVIIKVYRDYDLETINQSCDLFEKFNKPDLIIKNNSNQKITRIGNFFLVVMHKIEGRLCSPFDQVNTSTITKLVKKISKLDIIANDNYILDSHCMNRLITITESNSLTLKKYKEDILYFKKELERINFSFLKKHGLTLSHHDINPDNIIIDNKKVYLLDWDKACNAYYIDEVCRAAFLVFIRSDTVEFSILNSFFKLVSKTINYHQYLEACFMVGVDIYSEIVLCCSKVPTEKVFLSSLPRHLHPSQLFLNTRSILEHIKEFDNR